MMHEVDSHHVRVLSGACACISTYGTLRAAISDQRKRSAGCLVAPWAHPGGRGRQHPQHEVPLQVGIVANEARRHARSHRPNHIPICI